jgi:uncharacterized cupin superfamily protein
VPKIKPESAETIIGTSYPEPFDKNCNARMMLALSDAGDLDQFGVYHVTLPPGKWASQRHWHSAEDEFVYILKGTCVLIDDLGETPLKAGDSCTHKAGDGNAHHLVNNSENDVEFLVVGTRNPQKDHCHYPDINLDLPANETAARVFTRKSGREY